MAQTAASRPDREEDLRVLERARRSAGGISGVDIARASLGWKAKRHTMASLDLIGLAIAARLVGAGLLQATRSNRFVGNPNASGDAS